MGCTSCGTSHNGLPAGCRSNGACGTYGCNKLDVFDWLAGVELPAHQKAFDIAEIRFKSSRKGFYRVPSDISIQVGDVVAVEASPGHDMGVVSLTGELVRMQMKRKEVKDNYEIKKIYRKAKEEDISRWQESRALEANTMVRARDIASELRLAMKISDVEFQGDKTKATFFYSAEDRVDFRELIRRYADEFKVRIEMRQIGLRLEAQRIGGIGSCGRELCCSSWLTDFRSVSTSAARYQQLSLNPAKLAGQCGKLKCCLNYELDQYLEALRDIPSPGIRLQLARGAAHHFKTDIFQRLMYYIVEGAESNAPVALSIESVKAIIEMNKAGQKPEEITEFVEVKVPDEEISFANVVGQDSLTRFDTRRNKNRGRGGRNEQGGGGQSRPPSGRGQGNRGPKKPPESGGNPPSDKGGQPRQGGGQKGRPPRRQGGGNRQGGGAPNPPGNPPGNPPA